MRYPGGCGDNVLHGRLALDCSNDSSSSFVVGGKIVVQRGMDTGGTGSFIQRLALPEDVRSGETCRLATADMVIVLRGLLFSVGVGYFCR